MPLTPQGHDDHSPPAAQGTRERILEIGLELFAAQGVEGTPLQQIADRLGITKAALYYHFKSKDEMLHALLAPASEDFERLLDAHPAEPKSPAQRRAFFEAYVDYLLAHRQLVAWIMRDPALRSQPTSGQRGETNQRRLERMVGGDDLDPASRIRATVICHGMPAAVIEHSDYDDHQLRTTLREIATMLLEPSGQPLGDPI